MFPWLMDDVCIFWLIVSVSGWGRGHGGRHVNIVNDELKLLLITCLSIVTVSWHTGGGGAMSRVMLSRQQTKMLFYKIN